jgi:hypothetical protein
MAIARRTLLFIESLLPSGGLVDPVGSMWIAAWLVVTARRKRLRLLRRRISDQVFRRLIADEQSHTEPSLNRRRATPLTEEFQKTIGVGEAVQVFVFITRRRPRSRLPSCAIGWVLHRRVLRLAEVTTVSTVCCRCRPHRHDSVYHARSRGTYGAPRIHAEPDDEHGVRCGRMRVARLMRIAKPRGVSCDVACAPLAGTSIPS